MSLQSFDAVILSQDLHLADGDGIEFCQPFGLRHPLIDEHRIQVFQIGQADQLRDIGVVADMRSKKPSVLGSAGIYIEAYLLRSIFATQNRQCTFHSR